MRRSAWGAPVHPSGTRHLLVIVPGMGAACWCEGRPAVMARYDGGERRERAAKVAPAVGL